MKAGTFFKHTGLAMGYFAFFIVLQIWVLYLYTLGMSLPIAFSGMTDPLALTNLLTTRLLELNDVITLLTYAACIAFFACFLFAEEPSAPLRAAHIQMPRRAVMLWAPFLLGVSYFFAAQGGMMLIPEDAPLMQNYLESVSVLEYGKYPALSIIATVLGAPMIEEVVFRGLVYKHLKRAMPLWLAVLAQALLFAIAHGQLLWMTYTFGLALMCALVYEYYDSIWPCIIIHMCFNGTNYLPFLSNLSLEPTGWLIVLLASLLLCALTGLMLLLYRRMTPARPERRPDHA